MPSKSNTPGGPPQRIQNVPTSPPICLELALRINNECDLYAEDIKLYDEDIDSYNKLPSQWDAKQSEGKELVQRWLEDAKALRALWEACQKIGACNRSDAVANRQRYMDDQNVTLLKIESLVSEIKALNDLANTYLESLNTHAKDADGHASEVRLVLRPRFDAECIDHNVYVPETSGQSGQSGQSESSGSGPVEQKWNGDPTKIRDPDGPRDMGQASKVSSGNVALA